MTAEPVAGPGEKMIVRGACPHDCPEPATASTKPATSDNSGARRRITRTTGTAAPGFAPRLAPRLAPRRRITSTQEDHPIGLPLEAAKDPDLRTQTPREACSREHPACCVHADAHRWRRRRTEHISTARRPWPPDLADEEPVGTHPAAPGARGRAAGPARRPRGGGAGDHVRHVRMSRPQLLRGSSVHPCLMTLLAML